MYLVDYHCHSEYSFDSKTKLEDVIRNAVKKGLKEVCITDHFDYGTEYYRDIDFLQYEKELLILKEKYKDKILVKFGIEIGLDMITLKDIQPILKGIPFDFRLASTHDINYIGPHQDIFWQGLSRVEGYRKYFEAMYNTVKVYEDFDSFGHLDYVVRYGPYKDIGFKYNEVSDILEETMKLLIHKGKGIEINTSGIRKGLDEFHPNKEILKRYFELGGEIITLGSDGHIGSHIGMDIDRACNLLLSMNRKYISTFDKRKLIMKEIND